MALIDRALLAVGERAQSGRVGAEPDQILLHRLRPARAEGHVVLGGAALVGVAGEEELAVRRAEQALVVLLERAAGSPRQGRLVEVEVDRSHLAAAVQPRILRGEDGRLIDALALNAGRAVLAVGVARAAFLGGAAAFVAALAFAAVLRRGGLAALRNALLLGALLPRRAVLGVRAPGLWRAEVLLAGGPRLQRALRVVAALLAKPGDADLRVIRALVVGLALGIVRLHRAAGQHQDGDERAESADQVAGPALWPFDAAHVCSRRKRAPYHASPRCQAGDRRRASRSLSLRTSFLTACSRRSAAPRPSQGSTWITSSGPRPRV